MSDSGMIAEATLTAQEALLQPMRHTGEPPKRRRSAAEVDAERFGISLAGSFRVQSIRQPRASRPELSSRVASLCGVAVLAGLGLFLACDIAGRPIALWDESRLAVNALEMSQRGFGLVTTYGFQPDLWNTKPPLLIWLEAGSMHLFGASEWALRLPSLLAGLATLVLVLRFSLRLGGR